MGKMVGLSRNLKMAWLNETVELLSDNLPEAEFKAKLNEYLSFEIKSPINIRKTREILMHLWYYDNVKINGLRSLALSLIAKKPDNSLMAHWCMLLVTYPIFVDVARIIGKLSYFEDEFTIKQLKEKIFDEWGERATLFHSIDKIIATMKALGVLHTPKTGHYTIIKREIKDNEVNAFLAHTGMLVGGKKNYTLKELREMSYMFPFHYRIEREMLMMNGQFTIGNFGKEILIGLKESN